jgi:hypothetical protein
MWVLSYYQQNFLKFEVTSLKLLKIIFIMWFLKETAQMNNELTTIKSSQCIT